MRVELIKRNGNILDISELITDISWSGSKDSVARSVSLGVISSPTDYYVPKVVIELGNMLRVYDENNVEIFRGYVFNKEKSSGVEELKIKAFDGLIYLLKNMGVFNFKGVTPEDVVEIVARDLGIDVGDVIKTGISFSKIYVDKTHFDIIMESYEEARKRNGKSYLLRMDKGKLNVIEMGSKVVRVVLESGKNLSNSTYTENAENVVNRVLIVDDLGNVVDEVEDRELINQLGILQSVYVRDDNGVPTDEALLIGIENSANIEGLGNIEFITGNSINIRDRVTGIEGKFLIISDEHSWKDGLYTVKLQISLK